MESFLRVSGFTAVHLKYILSMFGGTKRRLVLGERESTRPITLGTGFHFLSGEQFEESVQSNDWYHQLKLAEGKLRLVVQFNSSISSLMTSGVSGSPLLLLVTNTGSTTKIWRVRFQFNTAFVITK